MLALMLGDNLGLHQILGFTLCFTANYPCSTCKVRHDELIKQVEEDESLLRNKQNYTQQVQLNDISQTGIIEKCIWNEVPQFHCCESVGPDIMHDNQEGNFIFTLDLVIRSLIDRKYFSLEELNDVILGFDYGMIDKDNKPNCVAIEKGRVVFSVTASSMNTLFKYFGLMVGHLVHEGDFVWRLYLLLRKIMDIVYNRYIPKTDLSLLKQYIKEYNSLFLKLSPKKRLKNKQHHLVHYPTKLEENGPPVYTSSDRYEHLHQISKGIATSINSNVDLTGSISTRLELYLHSQFKTNSFLHELECGPSQTLTVSDLPEFQSLSGEVPAHDVVVEVVNWCKFKGTMYKPKMVLVTGYENNLPVFQEIKRILIIDSKKLFFLCAKLHTLYFDDHFHAYAIKRASDDHFFINQLDLAHYFPTVIQSPQGKQFITYKYGL